MVYPALLPLMRTTRLPAVEWTDAPADLNGLVRCAERRNLVSARVLSHFKRSLPYRHLWSAWIHYIFPRYLINGTIFGEHLLNVKCLFWISLKLSSEILFTLRIIQPDIIINVPIPVAARSTATVRTSHKPLPQQKVQTTMLPAVFEPAILATADPRFRTRGHRDQTVCYAFGKIRKYEYKAWKGTNFGSVNFRGPRNLEYARLLTFWL